MVSVIVRWACGAFNSGITVCFIKKKNNVWNNFSAGVGAFVIFNHNWMENSDLACFGFLKFMWIAYFEDLTQI